MMKGRVAIIGAGVSGLSIGQMLKDKYRVTVFEKDSQVGGLIKCGSVDGNLFHLTGGHVFNTHKKEVENWFWTRFNKDTEFVKANRNSAIVLGEDLTLPYPIENYIYLLDAGLQKKIIEELLSIHQNGDTDYHDFEDFLRKRFGETLYRIYFQPYNRKIWRRELSDVPLSWLEGKLPMPTVEEILFNNFNHLQERKFVHSSFYYPINGGSQFIADRLAGGLSVCLNTPVGRIVRKNGKWMVAGQEFDKVVFCGNLKQLPDLLGGESPVVDACAAAIGELEAHGTTTVFCHINPNAYSWVYLPDGSYDSHRIICTGNFSHHNNAAGKMTGTVEFTDYISQDEILRQLRLMPFSPSYISHHYEPYTYPVQNGQTREMVQQLKGGLAPDDFYLLGRFAEWEYCNMDVAMGAALELAGQLLGDD